LYAPTFKNVQLDITLNPVVIDELISFEGTYTLWERIEDSPSMLLVGAGNSLFYPKTEIVKTETKIGEEVIEQIYEDYAYLNPFRAYFQLLGGIEVYVPSIDDPDSEGDIKSMVMDFGEEEETAIENHESNEFSDTWYTLQGVQLDGKPTQKGVYIYQGKKFVVK
jgi:hypothetical protein